MAGAVRRGAAAEAEADELIEELDGPISQTRHGLDPQDAWERVVNACLIAYRQVESGRRFWS